ncbi:MAG: hypothetical protein O3A95_05280 [Planctomycetota bacterium]|nr:hypothetical protein [Planctomycetota bacterium]MDA1113697.1 hypothetical protein [Planctomycetota bacterium]
MALSWIGRLQGAFVVWSLLFLLASLIGAASVGFQPERGRYMASEFQAGQSAHPRFVLSLFQNPQGRKAVILDAAPDSLVSGVEPELIGHLVKQLRSKGMIVVQTAGGDAIAAAKDADVLVLTCDLPQYIDLDFQALASAMRGRYLLDYSGHWDNTKGDAAGLPIQNLARHYWPHWLDPDLEIYVEHLRATVPEGDGILLLPGRQMMNTQARARWYLTLNVKLGGRRLYLWNPQKGTSFVTEYFEWVQEYQEKQPWSQTQPIRLPQRDFSAITDFAPTRTLTKEEVAAAKRCDVQWILFWSHQPDFRVADWELVPVETALAWTAEANS